MGMAGMAEEHRDFREGAAEGRGRQADPTPNLDGLIERNAGKYRVLGSESDAASSDKPVIRATLLRPGNRTTVFLECLQPGATAATLVSELRSTSFAHLGWNFAVFSPQRTSTSSGDPLSLSQASSPSGFSSPR